MRLLACCLQPSRADLRADDRRLSIVIRYPGHAERRSRSPGYRLVRDNRRAHNACFCVCDRISGDLIDLAVTAGAPRTVCWTGRPAGEVGGPGSAPAGTVQEDSGATGVSRRRLSAEARTIGGERPPMTSAMTAGSNMLLTTFRRNGRGVAAPVCTVPVSDGRVGRRPFAANVASSRGATAGKKRHRATSSACQLTAACAIASDAAGSLAILHLGAGKSSANAVCVDCGVYFAIGTPLSLFARLTYAHPVARAVGSNWFGDQLCCVIAGSQASV
jgi:hypothetical protein